MTQADMLSFKEIIDKCIESTNATDLDIEVMRTHQVPETQEAKCFIACVQQKFGTVCSCINLTFYQLRNE